jgi:ribose 1,5-bisphosphate isomerase
MEFMELAETAEKIRSMEIRGAGRIARAAAEALISQARESGATDHAAFVKDMNHAADLLLATRPTAVSLPNAVHQVMRPLALAKSIGEAKNDVIRAGEKFVLASLHAVGHIGEIGARHIRNGDMVLTHCNSEAALACLFEAHRLGTEFTVFATEVRPMNQGLVTIKALDRAGIETNFIVDSAVRYFMKEIDMVIVGADAITVNGAIVNKIGTSQIALAANEARVHMLVAAETYKFAPRTILGELIEIEERGSSEVLDEAILRNFSHIRVRNPAFDVTPADYIDLIVTEEGAIPPQMAYIIIRDYLGWGIEEFHKEFGVHFHDQE